jgi:hypothetical protein
MARLRAQERMEFYPTVSGDINDALLDINATVPIRALDPSSGDGRTLKAIKEKFNTEEIYGIELDHNRVVETQIITGSQKTLWADALLEARISPKSFNLIFMNPPYDNLSAYGHQRLELSFIERYSPVLCPGGIMILIVSESLLTYSRDAHNATKKLLFANFYIMDAFKSNDPKFKQWILILKKKKNPKLPKEYDPFYLEDKSYWNWDFIDLKKQQDETFNYAADNFSMSIDANPDELKVFNSLRLSNEDILKASNANKKKIEQILTALKPQDKFKTLLPLKKSHITLLLTTGGLNGHIKGTPFVINGQIDRSVLSNTETEIDEEGREKTTEIKISKFTPKVSVMRIDTKDHPIIELN